MAGQRQDGDLRRYANEPGQLLIVTTGVSRVQRWGDPVQEIRKGDVVWIVPHQKHWHGAAPDSAMSHIVFYKNMFANCPAGRPGTADEISNVAELLT